MRFKKFKRFNIYAESQPIEGDVYIDMSKAETIEFDEHNCHSELISIIYINMNQSSYTVLNEGFKIEDLCQT